MSHSTYRSAGPPTRNVVWRAIGSRSRTNEAFCETLSGIPLQFHPGSVWEYSRATDVLGRLVEVVSGQTLGAYLAEHIFEPLGMPDTGFTVPAHHLARLAEPFAHDPDGGVPMVVTDFRQPGKLEGGGGGLVSTARDYARFLQFMLNKGSLDGVRLLSPGSVRLLAGPAWTFDGGNGAIGEEDEPARGGFFCAYGLATQVLASGVVLCEL